MSDYDDTYVKSAHRANCTGQLYRTASTVCIDRLGRVGNGGIVAHDYRCNRNYRGCPARVLVTERLVRSAATAALAEVRP